MHTSWVEMIIGAKEGHWFIIRRIQVKTDKKGQNEKTCALACLKETAAVETSSFILRFWVFLEHHFATRIIPVDCFVLNSWFHSTVRTFHCGFLCSANQTWIYSVKRVKVLWLMNDDAANLQLAAHRVRHTPQAAVEHQLCLDFHGNKGYELTHPGLT